MKTFVQSAVIGLAIVALPLQLAAKPAAVPKVPVMVGATRSEERRVGKEC